VVMNGPAANAGSMFSFLSRKGTNAPKEPEKSMTVIRLTLPLSLIEDQTTRKRRQALTRYHIEYHLSRLPTILLKSLFAGMNYAYITCCQAPDDNSGCLGPGVPTHCHDHWYKKRQGKHFFKRAMKTVNYDS